MNDELEKELIRFQKALEKDIKFLTTEKKRNYNRSNNIFVVNWDFDLDYDQNNFVYKDVLSQTEKIIKEIQNQYNTDREQKIVEMILVGERAYQHICTKPEYTKLKQQVKNYLIERIYEKD